MQKRNDAFLLVLLAVGLGARSGSADPSSSGKQDRPHSIGVALAAKADAVREDLLVPLAFSGPGLRLLARLRMPLGPRTLALQADYGMAYLWNRYGHEGATLDYGAVASWTVPVHGCGGVGLGVGPVVALDHRTSYLFSWDDAHAYWLGSEWLGLALELRRRLSPAWRFEAGAALALLGFVGRPPVYRYHKQEATNRFGYFLGRPFHGERAVSFADFQAARVDLALAHPRDSSDAGWKLGADLRLARTNAAALAINLSAGLYAAHHWAW